MSELPDGWVQTTVGNVTADIKSGLSRKLSAEDIGLPVLRSNNLNQGGEVNYDDIKYWYVNDPQGADTSLHFLQDEDLLVNFINSIAEIGKCSIYYNKLSREVIVTTNIMRVRVRRNCILPRYLLYLTQTSDYAAYIQAIAKPAVNQASFTTGDFRKWQFILPPLAEQRAIARILGTWDEAIALTESLIEALQQRKKGLMQKLLTGEVRFPGFDDEWEEVRLGKFLTESRIPGNDGETARKLTIKLYGKGVHEKNENRLGSKKTRYYVRKSGQFIYSKLDFLNGAFGLVPDALDGYETTLDLPAFDISDGLDPIFLLNYVTRENFYRSQLGRARGGRKARRVPPSELKSIKVRLPQKNEQDAISNVLIDLDNQVELQQNYLGVLREQKKGLMQQLLTGHVRVRVGE